MNIIQTIKSQPLAALSVLAVPAMFGLCYWKCRNQHPPEFAKYLVTAGSQEQGQRIAKTLLEKRLIACCNIVPNVKSLYTWQGKLQSSNEVLLIMKSKSSLFRRIEEVVRSNHSYEVFELLMVPILDGSDAYLRWVRQSTV